MIGFERDRDKPKERLKRAPPKGRLRGTPHANPHIRTASIFQPRIVDGGRVGSSPISSTTGARSADDIGGRPALQASKVFVERFPLKDDF
jgi:hypothetical protein